MIDQSKVDESYRDGYSSGLNWPDAWQSHPKPGGPWVPSAGYSDESRALYEQGKAENTAYLKGWEDGQAEKVATGRINPLRGTEKNARYHND